MLGVLFLAMGWIMSVFPWVLIAAWVLSLADPHFAWGITRVLNTISLPFLRMTRGMVPPVGQLDLSPLLVFLLAYVVSFLLANLARF